MRRPVHLARRGAVYYFRLALPADLARLTGRKELKRSLATREPRLARERWLEASAAAARLMRRLRAMPAPTEDEIQDAVRSFYQCRLTAERFARFRALKEYFADPDACAEIADEEASETELEAAIIRSDLSAWDPGSAADEVPSIVQRSGLAIDPADADTFEYGLLTHYINRALLEVVRRKAEWERGDFTGVPNDPFLRERSSAPSRPAPMVTMPPASTAPTDQGTGLGAKSALRVREAISHFVAAHQGLEGKYLEDHKRTLELFAELNDNPRVSELTRNHAIRFKDDLLLLPKNFRQRFPKLPPRQIIERNLGASMPKISQTTINNKYLANLRKFADWLLDNNLTRKIHQ